VVVNDGVVRSTRNYSLTGSALTSDRALQAAVDSGVPFHDTLQALSHTPAQVIRREHELGQILAGRLGDVMLLDEDLEMRHIWREGILV
jgi:N-acetylglucosamine-6-phosphate deacetylase